METKTDFTVSLPIFISSYFKSGQQIKPYHAGQHSATYFDWTKILQFYFDFGYYLLLIPLRVQRKSTKQNEKSVLETVGSLGKSTSSFPNSHSFTINAWVPHQALTFLLALFALPNLLRSVIDVFPTNPKDASQYFLLAYCIINLINCLISIYKLWIGRSSLINIAIHLDSKPRECYWRPTCSNFISNRFVLFLFCTVYICWPLSLILREDLHSVTSWDDYWENTRTWSCRILLLEGIGNANCTENLVTFFLAVPAKLGRRYSIALLCYVRLGLLLSSATLWLAVQSFLASKTVSSGDCNGDFGRTETSFYEEVIWLKKLSQLISTTFGHQASCQIFQVVLLDSVIIDNLFEGSSTEGKDYRVGLFHSLSMIAALLRDIIFLLISTDICSQVRVKIQFL